MACIHSVPSRLSDDPYHCNTQTKQRPENRQYGTWRPRLFRRYDWSIQNFHAGDFFCLLDFCRFVLLRQELKYGRLNFRLQKQIRVGHAENRQSADGRIEGIFFLRAIRRITSAEFVQFLLQFLYPSLCGTNAHVVVSVDLPEPAQFGLCGDQAPLQAGRRFHHRFPLRWNIDRRVFAREVTEILCG